MYIQEIEKGKEICIPSLYQTVRSRKLDQKRNSPKKELTVLETCVEKNKTICAELGNTDRTHKHLQPARR